MEIINVVKMLLLKLWGWT